MQLVRLDKGRALGFGLTWSTTDALSRKDQLQRAYRNGSRVMATFAGAKGEKGSAKRDDNLGHAKELNAPKGVTALSAAGQLGVHPKWAGSTVLLILDTDKSGAVAVVGLLKGNVIVDAVAQQGDANRLIDHYRQRCLQANAEYKQIGSREGSVEAFGWHDFIPESGSRWRKSPVVKIQPLKQESMLAWAGVGFLFLIAAIGAVYVLDMRSKEEARMRLARANAQEDPAALYEASSQALLLKPMLRANLAVREIREGINGINVMRSGWKLTKITCSAAGCAVTWARNQGTYAEFDESAPSEWRPLRLSDDLVTITHSLPFKLTTKPLPTRTSWSTSKDFLQTEASRWQRLINDTIGLKASLSSAEIQAIPPGKDPRQFERLPNAIFGQKWSFSAPWWTSEILDAAPDTMAIDALTVEFDGKALSYKANGIIYVQQ